MKQYIRIERNIQSDHHSKAIKSAASNAEVESVEKLTK